MGGGGKETPRQKMIGMMYLVLLALLAMNVSKEIINAFVMLNNKMDKSITQVEKGNNTIEQDFQGIVQLAAFICKVPSSMISIIGAEKQWFKAKVGEGEDNLDRKMTFCGHAINHDGLFLIGRANSICPKLSFYFLKPVPI